MAIGSSPSGSSFSISIGSRGEKKEAMNPSNKVIEKRKVFLTEGFAQTPKVGIATADAAIQSADYYRGGNAAFADPNAETVNPVQPRSITPFEYDNQPASIRIVGQPKGSNGQPTGKEPQDLVPPFTKFILENVQEGHAERSQIVETFGDFYVFFFGERPPVYTFSGTLINTKNVNWVADFMFMYETFLRGTRCVEANARALVTYGGRQIEGFILNTNNATVAATEAGVSVSFQVLVTDRRFLFLSSDFGILEQNGKLIEDESFLKILSHSGLSRAEVSQAYEEAQEVLSGNGPAGGVVSQVRGLLGR